MIARPLSLAPMLHVIRHLRPRDEEEVLCLAPGWTLEQWARETVALRGNHFLFYGDDGEPIAAGGWSQVGVRTAVNSWLISTASIGRISDGLHRFAVRGHKAMISGGVRRFQTLCLHSGPHSTARRWMKRLGYRLEGIHRAMGAAGQDLITMARVEG